MARMLALASLWTLPYGPASIPESHLELASLAARSATRTSQSDEPLIRSVCNRRLATTRATTVMMARRTMAAPPCGIPSRW